MIGQHAGHEKPSGVELGLIKPRHMTSLDFLLRNHRHLRPHKRHGGQCKQAQVISGSSPCFHRVFAHLGKDFRGNALERIGHFFQRGDERSQRFVASVCGDKGMHGGEKGLEVLTLVGSQFSSDQIQRLDTIGAFIDLGDAHIAHKLLNTSIGDITRTPMDLHGQVGHFKAHVGEIRFDHWREHCHPITRLLAFVGIWMLELDVQLQTSHERQSPCTLGKGTGGQ